MAAMGGLPQLAEMIGVAAALSSAVLVTTFLVGKSFRDQMTRKRIMVGAAAICLIAFFGYLGFIASILSGNLD